MSDPDRITSFEEYAKYPHGSKQVLKRAKEAARVRTPQNLPLNREGGQFPIALLRFLLSLRPWFFLVVPKRVPIFTKTMHVVVDARRKETVTYNK